MAEKSPDKDRTCSKPVCVSTVLCEELQDLDRRRACALGQQQPQIDGEDTLSAESRALARGLSGMCLSGGGIRSATFNLGILQGLAERGLLPELDYLSTVSGGGYVGSWLHAIIRRHGCQPAAATGIICSAGRSTPASAADDPVNFLRKYSNYLAPRFSPLSTDVWVIGSIWLRNFFLNQCVLLPCFAALLLCPLLVGVLLQTMRPAGRHGLPMWAILSAAVLLILAVFNMAVRLREIAGRAFPDSPFRAGRLAHRSADAGICAFLIFVAAVLMSSIDVPISLPWLGRALVAAGLWFLFLVFQLGGGFIDCCYNTHRSIKLIAFHLVWMPVICAAVTTALLYSVWAWTGSVWPARAGGIGAWNALSLGPPLVVASLCIGVSLLLGLMGADYTDAAREWLSRLGAVLCLYSVGWTTAFALGVYTPYWLALLSVAYWKMAVTAGGGWLLTSAGGVLAGISAKAKGPNALNTSKALELIGKIAPTVFLIGYLAIISVAIHWGVRHLAGVNMAEEKSASSWAGPVVVLHWTALDAASRSATVWTGIAVSALALSMISVLLAIRANINEFSMHHFYKNRLVRCYLGASQGRVRRPNSWTGFDPQDDLPLQELRARTGYYGPYPIVNTALNINRGSELAKQERKAASFVYTPLYCGFTPEHSDEDIRAVGANGRLHPGGYRSTSEFGGAGGPGIGTAMAISGAAANPNMGYHTSGGLSFLMTVFNVRLGWWVGNPRIDGPSRRPGPWFALWYLIAEAAGRTTDRSHYLNLSDGGHFDNIGLYELVRRRCRFILVGDAEQDPGLTFGSLASAIRKCRTDFGVEIDIDLHAIEESAGGSRAHCVVGVITYPEQDLGAISSLGLRDDGGRATGLLVYWKASLTGDEPADVREYRSRFQEFPHESTADQFFTESQFESYRRLGLHIVRTTLNDVPHKASLVETCLALARQVRTLAIAG